MAILDDNEARLLVLEMTVAALVAQLPKPSLEEVVSMLAFVAGVTDGTEGLAEAPGKDQLAQLRYWAEEMLNRAMTSRKLNRPHDIDPEEAVAMRFVSRPAM